MSLVSLSFACSSASTPSSASGAADSTGSDAGAATTLTGPEAQDLIGRLSAAGIPLQHYVGSDSNGPCGIDLTEAGLINASGLSQIEFTTTTSSGDSVPSIMSTEGFDSCSYAPTGPLDAQTFQITSIERDEGSTFDTVRLDLGVDANGAVTVTGYTQYSSGFNFTEDLACADLGLKLKLGQSLRSCANLAPAAQ